MAIFVKYKKNYAISRKKIYKILFLYNNYSTIKLQKL